MERVADRLERVRDRILAATTRAGRDPATVALMAVSKLQPDDLVLEAVGLGLDLFGESRVQETAGRRDVFGTATVHLIGHLQRNKVARAAALYDAVDSIEALRTAEALDRAIVEAARPHPLPILLEVNTSGEPQKYGVTSWDDLLVLAHGMQPLRNLRIEGLMTVGPYSRDEAVLRPAFASLRAMRDRLERDLGYALPTLSMGMSGDLESAVLEGSTVVRVGTALFGERA